MQLANAFGEVSGLMQAISKEDQQDTLLQLMISETMNTSLIEGEYLSREDVMSSIKRQLGIKVPNVYVKDAKARVINYHRVIGDPVSWGSVNPNSDKLLTKAINKGYSLRQDAFGMTDYYLSWEKQFAKTWNNKRPIIMEGGWITTGTHRYWIDPSGKYREGHPEDVRQGEFDASAEAKVNMMDFRVGEIASWFEKSFGLTQRFVSEGGYRLYPDRVSVPEKVQSGAQVTLSHRWRNMGWGYFPNNIPQWNYKYKPAFALLDENGVAKKIIVDPNSEPSNLLKGTPQVYIFTTNIDVPSGKYSWAIAIVDTTEENAPAINLALNENLTPNGWVKLVDLEVE